MSGLLDPLELSRALIRCPSVTPEEGGALDVLQEALESIGFTCRRLPFSEDGTPDVDNLYARYGTAAPNLCFAGHTDVVPPGDRNDWSVDPFGAQVREGRLIGRGASDMKCAVACFAAAAARYVAANGGFDGSISFLITGDEEGPAINGTVKVLDWLATHGEVIDHCVVGEPTSPSQLGEMIKIGRRGSLNGRLTVTGVQGHTAYPQFADNPATRLVRMLGALIAEPLDQGSDHFQPSNLEITSIDIGNPATNVIPGRATAMFNVRFNDLHDSAAVTDWLRARLDGVATDYDLRIEVSGESFLTPPGRLTEVIAGAVERVTGRRPELSTTGGTSDARFIKDHCPVAEFGLISDTAHKVDENAAVDDIRALTDIYLAILEDYFAGR